MLPRRRAAGLVGELDSELSHVTRLLSALIMWLFGDGMPDDGRCDNVAPLPGDNGPWSRGLNSTTWPVAFKTVPQGARAVVVSFSRRLLPPLPCSVPGCECNAAAWWWWCCCCAKPPPVRSAGCSSASVSADSGRWWLVLLGLGADVARRCSPTAVGLLGG